MTTIPQLPPATLVDAADELPISQAGTVRSVTVSGLLAGVQPALQSATGTLLGRVSLGAGAPEAVAIGTGLSLDAGTLLADGGDHTGFPAQPTLYATDQAVISSGGMPMLLQLSDLRGLFSAGANVAIDAHGVISAGADAGGGANAITVLPTVAAISAADLVGVSQGGADHTITYANFLDGQTIDQSAPATAAADTDVFWAGQGSNVLARQTLSAVWTWVAGHLPGYRRPVLELTGNTLLDGSVHNNAILICSTPLTLTPAFVNMGSGFACEVVNLSGGAVTLAAGITTSTGASTLANGQFASLRGAGYSGGNVVFAAIAAAGSPALPGQVAALAAGTPTFNTVGLAWSAPASGGPPVTYTIQFRVTGTTSWSTASTSVPTNSFTVAGLAALTGYDFQVIAANAAGVGAPSATAHATTTAAPAVPGQVTGLAASGATASSVALTWSVPTSGGAVATYTVQYRVTGGSVWSTASTSVVGITYTAIGLVASTGYDFQVFATNVSGAGPISATVHATTSPALPGQVVGLTTGSIGASSIALAWSVPVTGGAPTAYTVQFRVTGASVWNTASSSVTALAFTVTGLVASTSYDFQVIAANVSGAGAASATASANTSAPALVAPGQVGALSAGSATAASVALAWTAPSSGGAVAGYTVQYRITGSTSWTTASTTVTVTSLTVGGLSAATSYDFQVIATNAAGSGLASSIASATTLAAALSPPGQVIGLATSAPTSSSIALTWAAPTTGGAAATYSVQYRISGTTSWTVFSSTLSTTGTTVAGLSGSTGYDFEVIAANSAGSGPASAIVTASTTAAVLQAPGQVTGVASSAPTTNSIALSWTAPATGGAVATYTVQNRVTGSVPWAVFSSTLTSLATTVTGLVASTSYDFEVIAVNATGSGPASAIATATTAASLALPGSVSALSVGTASASTLPLTWTAPTSGGAVASYTVQYRLHGASAWTTASSTVGGTSYTIGGLTAATNYDVQVFAINAAGSGTPATVTTTTAAAAAYTIVLGFLPPASTYTRGQTSIGINMKCDPTPPGNVLNFGWSSSATVAPTAWAATATNFNVDYFGAYVTAPATAGTYYFWAQTTDAAASYVSAAIAVT